MVVDGGVVEVVVDGEEACAYGAKNQRADDDAVPVGGLLERVGGAADGVALVVGDAALLDIADDVRASGCRGGGRRCAVWSSGRALRREVSLLEEEYGVPVEDVEDADAVQDAAAGEDVGEEMPEELRRRGDEELAVRRGHRRRPSSGSRARRHAAAGRAEVLEELQRERQRLGRRIEGHEPRGRERRDVERLEEDQDDPGGFVKGGNGGALCVGVRNGWPSAVVVTYSMTDAVSVARMLERPRQRWWGGCLMVGGRVGSSAGFNPFQFQIQFSLSFL